MEIVKAFNSASKDVDLKLTHVGMRNIRDETRDKYLSKFTDLEDRNFVRKVLDETIYISEDEFLKELNDTFDAFSEKIGNEPFYIYLPKERFSSENIFTIHLWKKIIRKNFIKFVNTEYDIMEGTNVVIIDDCIYTGNNTLATIDEMTYKNKNKMINFHIVIPYISYLGKNAITSFKSRTQIFTLNFYNTVKVINFFARPENEIYEKEDLIKRFKLEFFYQVPIYFDHKVANNFSTFDSIYLQGIVPGQENYGLLINYLPDIDVKKRIYEKYFVGLNLFT